LCVIAAQQKHRRSCGDCRENFGIAFRREFQALGQHEAILVRI
jgi:hypothetical protein